jgi:hypothetical protein
MARGSIITKSDHSRRVRKFRSFFLKFGDRVEAAAKDMHSLGGFWTPMAILQKHDDK